MIFLRKRTFASMYSSMLGKIICTMESFIANFTSEFLLSLVLS